MAYRSTDIRGEAGRVVLGPFPISWSRVLAALGAAFVALAVTGTALDRRVLTCDQATDRCVLETQGVFGREPIEIRASDLVSARVVISRREHGAERGVPILVLRPGERRLRPAEPEQARAFATRVRKAIERGGVPDGAELHGPRWLLVPSALAALAGICLAASGLRGIGRILIAVEPVARRLSLRRTVFGVPVSRSTVPLEGVADVQVEWRLNETFWHSRHQRGDTEGRLFVVNERGDRWPIVRRFHRGYTLHLEAERALRELLDLEDRRPELQERLDAEAERVRPAPSAMRSASGRFAAAWTGACCGSLAGLALVAVVGAAGGWMRLADDLGGSVMAIGGGGGALGGIALALYLTRARPPR